MIRRTTTVLALAVAAALTPGSPARADHTTDHHRPDDRPLPGSRAGTPEQALRPAVRRHRRMRDANSAGEFSDPVFWDTEVIPTFADYYLDAYAA